MISALRRMVSESFAARIYTTVRTLPIIKVIFDFEYTARLWNKSWFYATFKRIVKKAGFPDRAGYFFVGDRSFVLLFAISFFSLCLGSGRAVLVIVVLATLFVSEALNKNFLFVFLFCMLFELFAVLLTVSFAVRTYYIYVGTGILIFFIIKYMSEQMFLRFLKWSTISWLFAAVFTDFWGNTHILTLIFLPYGLLIFCHGKYGKHLKAAVLLGIGFYSLAKGDIFAVACGCAELLFLVVTGDWWLLFPIFAAAPTVFSFAEILIKNKVFTANILQTGFFLWRYGFGGNIADMAVAKETGEGFLSFVQSTSSVAVLIFFWNILRVSRSKILQLFRRKSKNNKNLRFGIGAFVGFSIYTFFTYGSNLHINIIAYLGSAAMLMREENEK